MICRKGRMSLPRTSDSCSKGLCFSRLRPVAWSCSENNRFLPLKIRKTVLDKVFCKEHMSICTADDQTPALNCHLDSFQLWSSKTVSGANVKFSPPAWTLQLAFMRVNNHSEVVNKYCRCRSVTPQGATRPKWITSNRVPYHFCLSISRHPQCNIPATKITQALPSEWNTMHSFERVYSAPGHTLGGKFQFLMKSIVW